MPALTISPIASSIFLFLVGASLGSFLNVVALRLISRENFLFSRSHCVSCKSFLRWFELVPIVSFIVLGGKCLNCRKPISSRYLLVELAMGAYLAAIGLSGGRIPFAFPNVASLFGSAEFYFNSFLYAALGAVLAIVFLIDFDTRFILVSLTRPVAVIGLFLTLLDRWLEPSGFIYGVLPQILTVAGTALFFVLIWFATHGRGMGLGDAELALALGFFLPFPLVLAMLLFSFWVGAAFGIILLFFFGYSGKSQIPFGPFIVFGFIGALFWGQYALSYFLPMV